MRPIHLFLASFPAFLLISCAVGPDYVAPTPELPAEWQGTADLPVPISAPQSGWWKQLGDPLLDALVEEALVGSYDLRLAEARILEARGRERSAEGTLFPQIGLSGSTRRTGGPGSSGRVANLGPGAIGGNTLVSSGGRNNTLYQAGFDASWEIDLFGGLRRAEEVQEAERQATMFDRDATRLSLAAEVARNYVEFRLYQAQILLARRTGAAQGETARITDARFRQGIESGLEVERATATFGATEAQIPLYDNLAGASRYRLELLLGKSPGALAERLASDTPTLPALSLPATLDTPLATIARRPDVAAAERRLASATALQGVAIADLYPKISLSGLLGFTANTPGALFDSANRIWTATGNITMPLLDFGRLRGGIDVADAAQQQAMVTYESTVQAALHEVETALLAYLRGSERRDILARTTEANRRAMTIARLQYGEGILSQLDVLDAERSLYSSENELANAIAEAIAQYVALNKALGMPVTMATEAP